MKVPVGISWPAASYIEVYQILETRDDGTFQTDFCGDLWAENLARDGRTGVRTTPTDNAPDPVATTDTLELAEPPVLIDIVEGFGP